MIGMNEALILEKRKDILDEILLALEAFIFHVVDTKEGFINEIKAYLFDLTISIINL